MSSNRKRALSTEDMHELHTYFEDTIELLVNEPDQISVETCHSDNSERGDLIRVSIYGPRDQMAMVIGCEGATVRALHRVFFSIARRMGFSGQLRIDPRPEE